MLYQLDDTRRFLSLAHPPAREYLDGVVQSIATPEVIEGTTISAFSKGNSVTAGGNPYDYAEKAIYDAGVLNNYDMDNLDDTTYNIYLDTYGNLIGIEIVTEKNQYVFITGYNYTANNLVNANAEAAAIFADDGRMEKIDVDVADSDFTGIAAWTTTGGDIRDNSVNKWYTYSEKDGAYKLDYVEDQFQEPPCQIFHKRGHDHSSQEQKE